MSKRRYIGDGVFAGVDDGGRLYLDTENYSATGALQHRNRIIIEPTVWLELVEFVDDEWLVKEEEAEE